MPKSNDVEKKTNFYNVSSKKPDEQLRCPAAKLGRTISVSFSDTYALHDVHVRAVRKQAESQPRFTLVCTYKEAYFFHTHLLGQLLMLLHRFRTPLACVRKPSLHVHLYRCVHVLIIMYSGRGGGGNVLEIVQFCREDGPTSSFPP